MSRPRPSNRRRVVVVTGSRAEFGLLRPVMLAIQKRPQLDLHVVVAGEHLLAPAHTWRDVAREFRIDARVPMQRAGDRDRLDHSAATGRGLAGFAIACRKLEPDWVVVLGDRVEAFAAAAAASIAGAAVCHIHGGDRAEGIADEAMRHAITKLAHLHCAATKLSAERIVRMGEHTRCVLVTGSPAIDDLRAVRSMSNANARKLGNPRVIVLLHPSGLPAEHERRLAESVAIALLESVTSPVLILAPNHDPGRDLIMQALARPPYPPRFAWTHREHLPRAEFLSLLKRLATTRHLGVLVGNSSAGLIEAAAFGLPVVNVGPRQAGRERAENVVDVEYDPRNMAARIVSCVREQPQRQHTRGSHPFGDGRAGPRIARLLEITDPAPLIRKRNSY